MLDAHKVNYEEDISYEFKRLKQNNKVGVKMCIYLLSNFKRNLEFWDQESKDHKEAVKKIHIAKKPLGRPEIK